MIEILKAVSLQFESCVTIADMENPARPLVFVNQHFADTTGYERDFALGKNCSFLQGRLTDRNKIEFMRASFRGNSSCCVDLVNYKKNGDPFWNRLVIFPLPQDGKMYFVGLQNDITRKKQRQNTEADLSSIKDSEVCHKIKNPLTIVLALHSQLKNENSLEQKAAELQSKVKAAILRIDDFVINLENSSEFSNWKY